MLPQAFVPTRPWRSAPRVASTAAATVGLVALAVVLQAPPPCQVPARVAIRVTCDDAAACERVAADALDVWSEARGGNAPLDVVVLETELPRLDAAGVRWEVIVPDIDAAAQAERERLRSPAAARPGDWFAEYRDYRAITTYLHDLAASFPDRVAVEGIGSTLDGRSIWAIRIGNGATPMLVNGTQHAREWISAMVSTCVADRLVRGYDTDPAIRDFVDHTELWVVPVANPDGYQHSWASDRYWRKNRRGGYGVDLNRNYDIAWGGDGSSGWKRSDVYRGEAPFSEPETRALRDLAKRERVALHLDLHAYGQLVLYPWGFTATPAPDRDRYAAVGDRIASAIFAQHESRYRLMSSVELYRASGTMTDWMYGEAGALSYTIELRPRGRGGFVLPPSEIRPTCDEGLAAVLALRYSLQ
jgi:hypothetical protein